MTVQRNRHTRSLSQGTKDKLIVIPLLLLLIGVGYLYSLMLMPKATVSQSWPEFERSVLSSDENGFIRTQTQRVDYFHKENTDISSFVDIVDSFIDFANEDFFPLEPDQRSKVFVSSNSRTHDLNKPILFGDNGGPSMGTFYGRYGVLATYGNTGPGTINSLLVYPMLSRNQSEAPSWAKQAVVTFFEKAFGVRQPDGSLAFHVGYHNPWRILEVEQFDTPTLQQVIDGGPQIKQSHYRLVAMFLWHHRHFKDFIVRLRDQNLKDHENLIAAAFDSPMNDVEELWRQYLKDVDSHRDVFLETPVSRIFESEEAFHDAMDGLAEPRVPKNT